MTELPSGTVTFLYADIAGWGRIVRAAGDAAVELIEEFERVVGGACEAAGGQVVDQIGDTLLAVFPRARDAVAAAADTQRRVASHEWPGGAELRVAVGLHTGEPSVGRRGYVGLALNRTVRIANLATAGQVLASHTTASIVADGLPPGVTADDLGELEVPDFDRPERVVQLVVEGVPAQRGIAEPRAAPQLPGGTVTMLFSDIEGSTRLLRRLGERWGETRAEHRRLVRDAAAAAGGREVDNQGDAFFFVFARARDAVVAAANAQRALEAHPWPEGQALRVRMGIHTGEPTIGDDGYLGLDVVRAARICAAGHGGQILVSATTRALLAGDALPAGLRVQDVGRHALKDLDDPEHVFQVVIDGLPAEFPPLKAAASTPAEEPAAIRLAGRELELAGRTLAAVQELQALPELGATIERGIEEALRAAGVALDAEDATRGLQPRPRRRQKPGAARAVAALALAAFVIGAVYLLVTQL